MSLTLDAARDEIHVAFWAAWSALDPVPAVYFDGQPRTSRPVPGEPWAQVVVRHTAGNQVSIPRKFENVGIVMVGVFGTGREDGQALAEAVRTAFEGQRTPSGVWFRDVRVIEIGPDDAWHHWSVTAEFRWVEWR